MITFYPDPSFFPNLFLQEASFWKLSTSANKSDSRRLYLLLPGFLNRELLSSGRPRRDGSSFPVSGIALVVPLSLFILHFCLLFWLFSSHPGDIFEPWKMQPSRRQLSAPIEPSLGSVIIKIRPYFTTYWTSAAALGQIFAAH